MTADPKPTSDPRTAFISANAFLENAEVFFSKMPKELHASAQYTFQNFGGLIAAATNLALAVELYLKCLAITTGRRVIFTHELIVLFNELPKESTRVIEASYKAKLTELTEVEIAAMEVAIGPTPPTETPSGPKSNLSDLRSLLMEEKDAFINWRYMFEAKHSFMRLNFRRLRVFANILRSHIQNTKN